jgi:hypothetical protein
MSVKPLKWEKDPDEELDFTIDWGTNILTPDADAIETSTWITPDGITSLNETNTDTMTTFWVGGGTLGEVYEIVNRITTTGGRIYDQTARLKVVNR